MEDKCVGAGCSYRFKDKAKAKRYRKQSVLAHRWLLELLRSDGVDVTGTDASICYKCFKKYERKWKNDSSEKPDNEGTAEQAGSVEGETVEIDSTEMDTSKDTDDSPEVSLLSAPNKLPLLKVENLFYGAVSHHKCSVCCQYVDVGLSRLPKLAKRHLIFLHKLWCPDNSRVCSDHLIGDDLHPDVVVDLTNRDALSDHLAERGDQVINDLFEITHALSEYDCLPRLDFTRLKDDDCKAWTGWTLDQIKQMHSACVNNLNLKSSTGSSTENALLLFWAKIKTNISWPQLSSLCGVPKGSVSRIFHAVLSALCETVVPRFLGTDHMTRLEAINHNTTFTKCFYGDKVTVILDGTYIYIPKSSDHKLQRSSYSGQKKRNFIKFMSIVLPDGYVLDTIGPFYGNENDAKITEAILQKIGNLSTWLEETDSFIVDRGFRDVLELLKSSGYEPHMPSYLQAGQSQHESVTANDDRRCTKTRWVVESYHGRLKQWRMFKEQLNSNYFVPVIGDLVQVVTACLNGIRGPIYKPSPERDARDQLIADRMQARLALENSLAERVKSEPELSKRSKAEWVKLDASKIVFPKLDLEYLQTVTCGTYQLKLAPGYIEEHMTTDGDYEVWVYQHSADLIRGQIRSRHKSQVKYNVWIRYDILDNTDPIKDYYCICTAGRRTVGMCAHTASIIYFLGYMAHQSTVEPLPYAKKFKSAMLS